MLLKKKSCKEIPRNFSKIAYYKMTTEINLRDCGIFGYPVGCLSTNL